MWGRSVRSNAITLSSEVMTFDFLAASLLSLFVWGRTVI
ncbi:hypothetical protein JCM19238_287 [Vibrio ponticus]|nr:hypothetical protein JCM19238_287 [Vibrio ponticus]